MVWRAVIGGDPDDAPLLTREWFDRAEIRYGDKLLRPGRPATGKAKQLVTLRLAPNVLARLRASGPGWQTRAAEAIGRLVAPRAARRRG